jgi:flagellar basal body-associated protein FliL
MPGNKILVAIIVVLLITSVTFVGLWYQTYKEHEALQESNKEKNKPYADKKPFTHTDEAGNVTTVYL